MTVRRRIGSTIGATWLGTFAVMAMGYSTSALGDAAQPMRFERLSLDQGLSQSAAMAITQDATGFMWFGTENGLNRYDGYNMLRYQRSRRQPDGLTSDFSWVADRIAYDLLLREAESKIKAK